jgi:hypothetical protein
VREQTRSRMSLLCARKIKNRTAKERVSRMRRVLFSSSQQYVSFVRTTAILFRFTLLTSAMSTAHGCGWVKREGGGAHDEKGFVWSWFRLQRRMNHLVLLWGLLRPSDYGEWAREVKVNVAREIGLITVYSRAGSAEYLDNRT